MWISLYVVQTIVGAVFYRIYFNDVEEHILMNKPLLSLNDLLSVWGDTNTLDVYSNSPLFTKFKKLANEKLRRKN